MISVGSRRPVAVRWLFNLVILAVVLALLFLVWLRVVRTLTATIDRPPPVGKPKALAWGDRVFSSQAQLQAWLEGRGISYSVWARRHPGAVRVVAPQSAVVSAPRQTAPERAATSSQTVKKVASAPSTASKHVVASGPVASGTGNGSNGLVSGLLWAVALLLGVFAVAPRRLAARASIYWLGPEQRMILGAAAGAFAVGLLVASWTS